MSDAVLHDHDVTRASDQVIVVGAGLSGCACAARLGRAGVPVLLVNSALDVVGLPGYGPVVDWPGYPSARCVVAPLDVLEPGLLQLWLRWASVGCAAVGPGDPDRGGGFVVIDRRALSMDVKQLLESMSSVRLRQGTVVSVHAVSGEGRDVASVGGGPGRRGTRAMSRVGGVEVETAFGEVFRGAACVLTVGLGLGGRVLVGDQVLEGARYGEVAADPLLAALSILGVPTTEVVVPVGPRLSTLPPVSPPSAGHPGDDLGPSWESRGRLAGVALHPLFGERAPCDGLPSGPQHFSPEGDLDQREELRAFAQRDEPGPGAWVRMRDPGSHRIACEGVFPDGAATGEVYVTPGLAVEEPAPEGTVTTRLGHAVRGRMLSGLGEDGSVPGLHGVWAAGQVAGASGYVESLVSGSRVAVVVESWLTERTRREAMAGAIRVDPEEGSSPVGAS